ncbi:MAG: class I SAM-dependent methyltransferase [Gammaproteobacteria bacterium]|nr:class I SAM-dependent methyltransferase [Gammaproteobacteria bacterium]
MQEFWQQRYSEAGLAYGDLPNRFLQSQLHQLPRGGKVLVPGDGEGRNGVWLAQQGFDVTSVDYAQAGVDRSLALAKQRRVKINTVCADLLAWDWPIESFDAVVSIYLHFPSSVRKTIHEKIWRSLKPQGVLLMEAFNKNQLGYPSGGPQTVDALFSAELLQQDFPLAKFVLLEESVVELNEGKYHVGPGAVVRAILRKP